ncbi:MAG: GNAT family N-acetyltransferase [Phenylobacterium sp.]|uniref:GNAT family N-acetyltransferase n=1 Tax=Phenylobacterium sp. TaxID=1871053 RepID=UPI002717ED5B|nr:GNAT family N-acetyltransferase [Phenylobacterium sp.]MDO8410768.1 GNAT family N-acetyltransferase [Phenylobacterium sp.]
MADPDSAPAHSGEQLGVKMSPSRRPYMGESDLQTLLHFASRSLTERFPLASTWHPGDVAWELREQYSSRQPIRLWEQDGVVEAVAWSVGPGQFWLETTPAGEGWLPDIIGWAESAALRRQTGVKAPTVSVRVFEGDRLRIAGLSRLGFKPVGPESVHFEFDLTGPLPEVPVPPGLALRDGVGIDPEQRAASHRDAWSALDHIGIENARSTFSAAAYESLRTSPVYRCELDLIAVASDGRLAANCICWADAPSGVGIFEPMGTHPAFRGRRLARTLLAEGLHRLRDMGHRRARISTAHFNTSAVAAYSSMFQPLDRSFWWARTL